MFHNITRIVRLDPFHWRVGLLNLVLWISVALGSIVYVPSVYMAFRDGLYLVVWADTLALLGVVALLSARRLAFRLRAVILCAIFYLLGAVLMVWVGPISQIYMIAFSLMTTLLLGLRTGIATVVLSTLTLASIGLFGLAMPFLGSSAWMNADGPAWLVISLNFAFISMALTLAVGGVLTALEAGMQREAAARAEMRENAALLRAIVDNEPESITITTPDGHLLEINPAGLNLVEVDSAEEVLGHAAVDFVHPGDRAAYVAARERAVATGTTVQLLFRVIGRRGTERWVEKSTVPLRDEAGHVNAVLCVSRDVTLPRNANELHRENEERLRLVTRATNDLIWDFDAVSKMIWWGDGFEDFFGSAPENRRTPESFWEERVHPEDRHRAIAGVEAAFQGDGEDWSDEYRMRRADGSYVHVLDRGFVVRDDKGHAVRMIGGITDLTERKRAEDALRQSEERFRLLSKATNDAIWDWNLVTDALWWNEGFETLFGFSRAEIEAGIESWTNRIHPEDVDFVYDDLKRAIASGRLHWEAEYRFLKADGTYASVLDRGHVIYDDARRPIRMVGGMTDLSEWKRSEAEREILYAAVEQLGEMVVIATPKGLVEYVNPAFARTTGFTREDILGKMPRVARNETYDEAYYQAMWEAVSSGQTWSGQLIHQRRDGSVFTGNAVVSPVRGRDGKIVRFVGVLSDATERLKLEEQFRQSQKMEAVGRLAGGIAHDFNNMLTVILVRAEQAAKRLVHADPLRASLKEIQDAALRSAGLTRQLLTYARRQSVEPRIVNLNETIGAMQQMLRRLIGEDITLDWVPCTDPWLTRIDPVQVDQVLANLCVNARDAIRDVGRIVIETQNVGLDAEYCRINTGCRPGEYVMIAVSDNGEGMDAQTSAHVFEPFFTTKEVGQGTGLGLATVYGIVQQNNGFIHVYSEPEAGSTFKLYLPRSITMDSPPSGTHRSGEPPRGRGETVLIVEDEPMILDVAVEILQGLEYKVLSTTSPDEAIVIAGAHKGDIHLLITDVIMPEMNGRDLAEKIRGVRSGIRVLFMSGYTANVIQQRGLVEKGDAFVQKPFSTHDLAARVRSLLDSAI